MNLVTAATPELLTAARRFWYSVYVEEMEKCPAGTDHAAREIHDALAEQGSVYCLMDGNEVVATLRRNKVCDFAGNPSVWSRLQANVLLSDLEPHEVTYSSKLIVSQRIRGRGTGMHRLVAYAYEQARLNGVQIDFLCCSPHLIPMYERLGFHNVGDAFYDRGTGLLVPMALAINDLEYLTAIESPFRRCRVDAPASRRGIDALQRAFPRMTVAPILTPTNRVDDVWEELVDELHSGTGREGGSNSNLSTTGIERLKQASHLIRVHEGETILDSSAPPRHVLVILSGSMEVSIETARGPRQLMQLGPGQVIGERALVQDIRVPETFTALSEVELLVVNVDELRQSLNDTLEGQIVLLLLRSVMRRQWLAYLEFSNTPFEPFLT